MIVVSKLSKTFRVPEREPGLKAALRSLLQRRYKLVHAVDDVSFEIAKGERVAFLGPNGAGKTTTLKMLAGLLVPSSGQCLVDGFDPRERHRDFLGRITLVMGQKQQLLWDLPPRDTFELNRALFDIPRRQYEETLEELTRLLSLGELLRRPVRTLSLGERMKCELSAALLHRPQVLFLDEPTIGLDVVMQVQVREFIRAWNERFNSTVLLTSHYMDDVAALCPRVIVIDQGRVRFDGPLAALVSAHEPRRRLRVRLGDRVQTPLPPPFVARDDGYFADVPPSEVAPLVQLVFSRHPAADLRIEEPPLEEVFAAFFGQTVERGSPK